MMDTLLQLMFVCHCWYTEHGIYHGEFLHLLGLVR
jgi:hypothetical protein